MKSKFFYFAMFLSATVYFAAVHAKADALSDSEWMLSNITDITSATSDLAEDSAGEDSQIAKSTDKVDTRARQTENGVGHVRSGAEAGSRILGR